MPQHKVNEEVGWDVENRNKVINSFSYTDKQIDREDKSGVRIVLENIDKEIG